MRVTGPLSYHVRVSTGIVRRHVDNVQKRSSGSPMEPLEEDVTQAESPPAVPLSIVPDVPVTVQPTSRQSLRRCPPPDYYHAAIYFFAVSYTFFLWFEFIPRLYPLKGGGVLCTVYYYLRIVFPCM